VSRGGNGNSSSSESGSLGISINLANLIHPIPPPSTTTTSTSDPLRWNPFVEPVGSTTPLLPTAIAVDIWGRILMTPFLGRNQFTCFPKAV